MRFMILLKANADTEAGAMPRPEVLTSMTTLMEEMASKGVLLGGEGLQPSSKGARVSLAGGRRTVTDGPFAETKELIAGYALIQCDSLAEAVEWAHRFLAVAGEGECEVRQIFEACDFPDEIFPPEEKAREQALRRHLD